MAWYHKIVNILFLLSPDCRFHKLSSPSLPYSYGRLLKYLCA